MSLFSKDKTVIIAPQSIIFTVFFLLSLYFVYYIRGIVLLALMSFIIMVGLRPLVLWFERKLGFKRFFAIATTYLLFFGAVVAFLGFILPPLVREAFELFRLIEIPAVEKHLRGYEFSINELNDVFDRLSQSVTMLFQVINTTFSGLVMLLTIFVISVYLMTDRENLHKKIGWFTNDPAHFKKAEEFLDSIELQLGGWVRGQLLLMISVGVLTYFGLFLLGIPHALPLALIAGLLEIVPNIGPTVSAIPAVIIGYLTFGPIMAGVVVLLFLVIQQLENNLLLPKIMSAKASVNPLVSILAILIGLKMAGVAGALLAIPIYIIARTVYISFFRLVDKKDLEKL